MPYDVGKLSHAAELGEPVDAPGVAYTTSEHAPGVKLFPCAPYRATVSVRSCGARWLKAQEARGDLASTLSACRTCTIGACHAGRGPIRYSAHSRSSICPRCGRGTTRMIHNRACVSCYNRARELRLGRNARGNKPIELLQAPLHPVTVFLQVDGEVRRFRDRETSGLTETMVQVLRTTTGEIAFAFAGAGIQRRPEGVSGSGEADGQPTSLEAAQGAEIGVGVEITPDRAEPDSGDTSAEGESGRRDACRYRRQLFAGSALSPCTWRAAG